MNLLMDPCKHLSCLHLKILNIHMKNRKIFIDSPIFMWLNFDINNKKGEIIMKAFVCKVCGFVSLNGNAPEKCPVCGAPKSAFELKEDAITTPKDPKNLTDYEKKHTPLIKTSKICSLIKECYDVNAIVGEIVHPMDADHFIHHLDFYIDYEFIARVILSPGKVNPGAGLHLKISTGKISVVEFCTKHGRWIGETNL